MTTKKTTASKAGKRAPVAAEEPAKRAAKAKGRVAKPAEQPEATELDRTKGHRSDAKRSTLRTIEEITEGLPKIARDDWRAAYHGTTHGMLPFTIARDGTFAKAEGEHSSEDICPALLAMPRDSDVGGYGSQARQTGHIAVHVSLTEDGSAYMGTPFYLKRDELVSVLENSGKKSKATTAKRVVRRLKAS